MHLFGLSWNDLALPLVIVGWVAFTVFVAPRLGIPT
jgi:hypothetical protein